MASGRMDIGHNKRNVLQIARRVSATIGSDFFQAIAKHLATALAADCVYVGEFAGGQWNGSRLWRPSRATNRSASSTHWQTARPRR